MAVLTSIKHRREGLCLPSFAGAKASPAVAALSAKARPPTARTERRMVATSIARVFAAEVAFSFERLTAAAEVPAALLPLCPRCRSDGSAMSP